MNKEQEDKLVQEIKLYVYDHLSLSKMSDDDLYQEIENIVRAKVKDRYLPIDQQVSIIKQVFSSIRGFGILDSIMSDDSITEVMINGANNIFIEKNGQVSRIDHRFESERQLEDIVQRIVGLAGRELISQILLLILGWLMVLVSMLFYLQLLFMVQP